MADKDITFNINVNTQEANQNIEQLNQNLDNTKKKVDEVGKETQKSTSSVGNFGGAFESTLNTATDMAGGLGGEIRTVTGSIKKAIPLVKTINSTALKGLTGIKAAIVSTGIGLLVIALGELIAHWDDLTNAVSKNSKEVDKIVEANEDYINATKELNEEIDFQARLMSALGASEREVLEYRIRETEAIIAQTEAQKAEAQSKLDEINAHTWLGRILRGENKQRKKLEESIKSLNDEQAKYAKNIVKYQQDIQIGEAKAQKTRTDNAKSEAAKRAKQAQEEAAKTVEAWKKSVEEGKQLEKETKDLESEQNYFANLLGITPEAAKELAQANSSIKKEFDKAEQTLSAAIDAQKKLIESGTLTPEQVKEAESRIRSFTKVRSKITKEASEESEAIVKESEDNIKRATLEAEEEKKQIVYDHETAIVDISTNFEEEKNQKLFDLEQQRLQERKTYLQELQKLEQEGSAEYAKLGDQIQDIDNQLIESSTRRDKQLLETSQANFESYMSSIQGLAGIMDTLINGIIDSEEARLDGLVKQGKLSQDEADAILNETMEKAKAWQIAQVWINALAGSAAALSSPIMMTAGPVGWIAAGVQAAALLTEAAVTTAKIKNTTYGSTPSSAPGNNSPSTNYAPVVDTDITPSPTMNIPVSSEDTRVYILESDIQQSNNRVRVREENTTW